MIIKSISSSSLQSWARCAFYTKIMRTIYTGTVSCNEASKTQNNSSTPKVSFSSLYLTGRYAIKMAQVARPDYHKKFLLRLIESINNGSLMKGLERRLACDNITQDMLYKYFKFSDEIPNLEALPAHLHEYIDLRNICEEAKKELGVVNNSLTRKNFKLEKWKEKHPDSTNYPSSLIVTEEEKNLQETMHAEYVKLKTSLSDVEEYLIPILLHLPNDQIREDVPDDEPRILRHYEGSKGGQSGDVDPEKTMMDRYQRLNSVQLSYINGIRYQSIIGPHSRYLVGRGAQIERALQRLFGHEFREKFNAVPFSGVDFVKSAVVEAIPKMPLKQFSSFDPRYNDACKVVRGVDFAPYSQTLHLVGDGSLYSICAFLTREQADPDALVNGQALRFVTSGAQYSHVDCSQTNTFQFVSLTARDYAVSNPEMENLTSLIWKTYEQFGIECRMIICPAHQLFPSEVCRYEIEVKLPSSGKWLKCGRISHQGDYVFRRFGLKLIHLIEGVTFDSDTLLSALIETHQCADGKFSVPDILKRFMFK